MVPGDWTAQAAQLAADMVHPLLPLGIIGLSIFVAVLNEVLSWALVYRTSTYKDLMENWHKHNAKVEASKEVSSKNVKKAEARMQAWKSEAKKNITKFNTVTGLVVRLGVVLLLLVGLWGGFWFWCSVPMAVAAVCVWARLWVPSC